MHAVLHATRPQLKPIRNFPLPDFSNSKYGRRVRYQHTKNQKSFAKRYINALLKIHNCIVQVLAYRTQHMKWLHPSTQRNITEHIPSWDRTHHSIRHRLEKRKKHQYKAPQSTQDADLTASRNSEHCDVTPTPRMTEYWHSQGDETENLGGESMSTLVSCW